MSRARRAVFLAAPAFLIACSDDSQAPTAATGGQLIFGNGGVAGAATNGGTSGASASTGGTSSDGGRATTTGGTSSSDGGAVSSSGGRASSNGGTSSDGGSSSGNGGSAAGSPGTGGGGPTGLPIGSLCANDSNCSPNLCCKMPTCGGPCECQPASNCPTSTQFLPCNRAADCDAYGGGKVCCRASAGSQTMQYCTKPSGCSGTTLP
jgi:hypothetical protein